MFRCVDYCLRIQTEQYTPYTELCDKNMQRNKTDISYLKTSQVFFYTIHSTERCVSNRLVLAKCTSGRMDQTVSSCRASSESADTAIL